MEKIFRDMDITARCPHLSQDDQLYDLPDDPVDGDDIIQASLVLCHQLPCEVLSCHGSGRVLALGYTNHQVAMMSIDDVPGNEQITVTDLPQSPLLKHTYAVNCVTFSPVGNVLATCSQDGSVVLWDTRSGSVLAQLFHPSRQCLRSCQFSNDGMMLATGGDDETVCLFDVPKRKLIRQLSVQESSIAAVCFTPDGLHLASGNSNGELMIWDAKYGNDMHTALVKNAHDLGVTCLQFSPTTGANASSTSSSSSMYLLATGGIDDTVKLWRVNVSISGKAQLKLHKSMKAQKHNIMCLAFSPNGQWLASGAGDRSVILWDALSCQVLTRVSFHQKYITCVSFVADGSILVTGSGDRTIAAFRLPVATSSDSSAQGSSSHEDVLVEMDDSPPNYESLLAHVPDGITDKSVVNWTAADVELWLNAVKLGRYAPAFAAKTVDGNELLLLNDSRLTVELDIENSDDRARILRGVRALRVRYSIQAHKKDTIRDDHNIPDEYLCPITREVMHDPVIAADGYTYERTAIESWLSTGRRTSPMTNGLLKHNRLTPNNTLKSLIHKM